MALKFIGDPAFDSKGWFDPALTAPGWFDQEFVETAGGIITVTASDSYAVGISEVPIILAAIPTVETLPVIATEAGSLSVTLAGNDAPSVVVTEVASLTVAQPATEDLPITLAEATDTAAQLPAADSIQPVLSEQTDIALTLSADEALPVLLDEVASILAQTDINSSDTIPILTDETASILVSSAVTSDDTVAPILAEIASIEIAEVVAASDDVQVLAEEIASLTTTEEPAAPPAYIGYGAGFVSLGRREPLVPAWREIASRDLARVAIEENDESFVRVRAQDTIGPGVQEQSVVVVGTQASDEAWLAALEASFHEDSLTFVDSAGPRITERAYVLDLSARWKEEEELLEVLAYER